VASSGGYRVEGDTQPFTVRSPQAVFTVVTPGYFRTLGVSVLRGRDVSDTDTFSATPVAVINEALARAAFPGQDPIGRRIQCGLDRPDFMTIVGVVSDVRTDGPSSPANPEIYMPFEQHPSFGTAMSIVARSASAEPRALADPIRRMIAARNPDVPVRVATMAETIGRASAQARFQTFLFMTFAVIALALALAGVYAVMTYSVAQRVPEMGVRVALGATPGNIRSLMLGQGARLAGAGLVAGLALALLSGRALQAFLFGVTPGDPLVLSAVALGVSAVTLAACYIPVRRACRVDPMTALRAE
jgi:predicted permease